MKTKSETAFGVDGLIEEGEAFRRLQSDHLRPRLRPQSRGRRFHVGMSVAFVATAFAGFAPTYYLKGATDAPPLSPLLHMHGLVFSSWLLLLFTQTALVARHRVDLHRRLGIAGAVLAAVMVPLGIATAIAAVRRAAPGIDPDVRLILALGNISMFGGFIAAAIAKRRTPELHRRLVMLATICIIAPAIARLPFVDLRPPVTIALHALFVLAPVLHDLRQRGRVHPVYLWGGLFILVSGPLRFAFSQTDAWHAIAQWIVG